MRHLGATLAGGLTFVIVLLVGIFSFLPAQEATQSTEAQPAASIPSGAQSAAVQFVTPPVMDTAVVEADLARREAIYQSQIAQLDQALQERQGTYQTQIQSLNTQVTTVQNELEELNAVEQSLLAQIAELETARAERLATYQSQLEQAKAQYNARFAEMQSMLNEIQTKLAEANTQLGL
jgi:DNA repair exonuclease SbcCD ATPase subunit